MINKDVHEINEIMDLLNEFASNDVVEALVLGGSRANNTYDEKSDYDIYVYLNKPLSLNERKMMIDPYVSYMEYQNLFWEEEDDGILKNGLEVEFIYRDIESMRTHLENLFKGNVSHGYSTCFLDNLIKSKIIFDRNGVYQNLQNEYQLKDKTQLYKTIILKNLPLVIGSMPSLYNQVEKAVNRGDTHAINHRLTEYFNIFYDILFALNGVTHPGEKRMLENALDLPLQPKSLKRIVNSIFINLKNTQLLDDLKVLSMELIELAK